MISERERKAREELFRLMRENPDLPVVPMVDGEILGDDSGYWLAGWGQARVDEYLAWNTRAPILSAEEMLERMEAQP